jgi:serine/threonine-protein kinase
VIGGVVAVILVSKGQNNGKPKVAIPSGVIGEQPAQAKAKFTAAKIKFAVDPAGATTNGPCADGSTPTTEGVVCTLFQNNQPVQEGDEVVQDSTVYYQTYVEKKVSVPPVTGESWNDAANQIHKLGLEPVRKPVNAGGTQNQVVAQDPEQFTTVTPGSKVTLSVTTGKYRLPDVTGMKVADAENKLYGKFNNIDDSQTTPTTDQSKDQTVASESPRAGKAYDPSTKITLIVFKYVPASPTCTTGGVTPPPGTGAPSGGVPSSGTTGVPGTGSALPPCTTP